MIQSLITERFEETITLPESIKDFSLNKKMEKKRVKNPEMGNEKKSRDRDFLYFLQSLVQKELRVWIVNERLPYLPPLLRFHKKE